MRRSAIIILCIAITCSFFLCGCTQTSSKEAPELTPFDKLKGHPSISEAKALYGEKYVEDSNQFGVIWLYYNYSFMDHLGELEITFSPKNGSDSNSDLELSKAYWIYKGDNLSEDRDAIITRMNDSYGTSVEDSLGFWRWKDELANDYTLSFDADYEGQNQIYLGFKIS